MSQMIENKIPKSVQKILNKVINENNIVCDKIKYIPMCQKNGNFMGVIYRILISGFKDSESFKISCVLKMAPNFTRDIIHVEKMYQREVDAYEKLFPALDFLQTKYAISEADIFKYPRYYGSDMTEYKEIIIMEDISDDFMMTDSKSLTYEQMVLIIKKLAKLHSLSFALKNYNIEKFKELYTNIHSNPWYSKFLNPLVINCIDRAIKIMDDPLMLEKLTKFKSNILQALKNYEDSDFTYDFSVFCHGDCSVNNVLFRYQDGIPVEVRILDWQRLKYASPVIDISYLIFTSTDRELRDKHYYELLDIYYDQLKINLTRLKCDANICYPRIVYEEHIKTIMSYGLIMAIITAPMFLSKPENIPNMENILKENEINDNDFVIKNENCRQKYKERITGIVEDFIKLNLI